MKVALLHKPYDVRIDEISDPKVGPEDVLLSHVNTGICGTDVNRYKGFKGPEETVYPAILGHEFAGEVTRVGDKVKNFGVGDRVYGIIPESLVEHFLVPQTKLFKLPDNVSLEEAQSLGPIGGTLHAISAGGIKIGDIVVILGPGHAGLILVQWAKIAGAHSVVITGTRENRLKVARDLGADITINAREVDPIKRVKEITNGLGADVIVEATGRPDGVKQAIEMAKVEGTVVIFGVGQELVDGFDIFTIYRNRLRMIGTRGRTDSERETALKYLASGKVTVKPIITHVLPLEETRRGFEIVDRRLDNVIRIVIES
ncbi:MAG TPA: zinc-binding dehydrogenase [Patescibacteria group bacterium]|nr:zinc-binding dehydrogenase [Patescibacteria group bacterium]